MDRIPLNPYDFFRYLASGLLVVVGMDMVFGFPSVIGTDFKAIESAVLLLVVYVVGHTIATPAKALLEDLVVARLLKRQILFCLRRTSRKPVVCYFQATMLL